MSKLIYLHLWHYLPRVKKSFPRQRPPYWYEICQSLFFLRPFPCHPARLNRPFPPDSLIATGYESDLGLNWSYPQSLIIAYSDVTLHRWDILLKITKIKPEPRIFLYPIGSWCCLYLSLPLSTLGIIEKYICIYFCSLLIITLFDRWTLLKATNEHLHNPMPSTTVIFSFQTWIPACWRRKLMIFIKFNQDSTWFVRYMGINNESWL